MTHNLTDSMYSPDVEAVALRVKKLHPEATIPTRKHKTDAGYDLYALEDTDIFATTTALVRTGIAIQPRAGYHTEIVARSSTPLKRGLHMPNGFGLIDGGYRGELLVQLRTLEGRQALVKKGERIAQLIVRKTELPEVIEVSELDDSSRGARAFGSSGL